MHSFTGDVFSGGRHQQNLETAFHSQREVGLLNSISMAVQVSITPITDRAGCVANFVAVQQVGSTVKVASNLGLQALFEHSWLASRGV